MSDFLQALTTSTATLSRTRRHLVGVSGGRDSMALLHGLHALGFRSLVVCHLNHSLRGAASGQDAALVRRTAIRLGYLSVSEKVDTRKFAKEEKLSLELAARTLRYEFFQACARHQRCPRLLLAHHGGDQVETVLFNFLRGTGTAGLGGMRPASRQGRLEILRPLLPVHSGVIRAYVEEEKISFHEDASNADPAYTRNRLRHEVLPLLRQVVGPSIDDAIRRAAQIAQEEEIWMQSLVPAPTETLSAKELEAMPLALRRRTVLAWLRHHRVPEAGWAETERVLSLLKGGPARASLPGHTEARRRQRIISLIRL